MYLCLKKLNFFPSANTWKVQKPKLIYVMYLQTLTNRTN